jgi:Heterokaryon incompatibility protein (HET)
MDQIFHQAHRVLAWLGEDDGSIRVAMNLAQHLVELRSKAPFKMGFDGMISYRENIPAEEFEEDLARASKKLQSLPQCRYCYDDPDTTPEDDAWPAWRNFLSREWFGRVWTMQEYLLAGPTSMYLAAGLNSSRKTVAHYLCIHMFQGGCTASKFCEAGIECLGFIQQHSEIYSSHI